MSNIEEEIKILVLKKLAEHIGVDVDDINLDDSLTEDLHLNPAEITDIFQKLSDSQIEIDENKIENIETVSDLIEHILSQPGVI